MARNTSESRNEATRQHCVMRETKVKLTETINKLKYPVQRQMPDKMMLYCTVINTTNLKITNAQTNQLKTISLKIYHYFYNLSVGQ